MQPEAFASDYRFINQYYSIFLLKSENGTNMDSTNTTAMSHVTSTSQATQDSPKDDTFPFMRLPDTLQKRVFMYTSLTDRKNIKIVCQDLNSILSSSSIENIKILHSQIVNRFSGIYPDDFNTDVSVRENQRLKTLLVNIFSTEIGLQPKKHQHFYARLRKIAPEHCTHTLDGKHPLGGGGAWDRPTHGLTSLSSGNLVSFCKDDEILKIWDIEKNPPEQTHTLIDAQRRRSLTSHSATLPNGQLITSSSSDSSLRIWDVTRHPPCIRRIQLQNVQGQQHALPGISCFTVLPSGDKLASVDGDSYLRFFDNLQNNNVATDDPYLTKPLGNNRRDDGTGHTKRITTIVALDNEQKVATGSYESTVKVWDFARNELPCIQTLNIGTYSFLTGRMTFNRLQSLKCMMLSKLLSVSATNAVQLYDTRENGIWSSSITIKHDKLHDMTVTPCGRLVTGSQDNFVNVWDLRKYDRPTHTMKANHEPQFGGVTSITAMPQGQLVTAGGMTIQVWDYRETHQPVAELNALRLE